MVKRLIIILIILSSYCYSQRFKDTVYYAEYNSSLIFAYQGSTKGYDVGIEQYMSKDSLAKSKIDYRAESNWTNGVQFSFDKISFSFDYSSSPPKNYRSKGNTQFYNLGFNIGGNKWILEANYQRYKGFYDLNTGNYDTSYKHTGNYFKQPSLNSALYKLKFLYFTNSKKFAYKSCYSSSFRQIKSAATWIITANAYYNTFNSDSSIIPSPVRNYYHDFGSLNGLDVFAFSVYGGAAANIVIWKHLVMNATLLVGPEDQYRTYKHLDQPNLNLNYVVFSYDFRAAIGLSYSKFFTFVSGMYDVTPFRSSKILVNSTYYTINFTMGFRIHTKYPKFYQKLQDTKLYKML